MSCPDLDRWERERERPKLEFIYADPVGVTFNVTYLKDPKVLRFLWKHLSWDDGEFKLDKISETEVGIKMGYRNPSLDVLSSEEGRHVLDTLAMCASRPCTLYFVAVKMGSVYPVKIEFTYDEKTTHWSSHLSWSRDDSFLRKVGFERDDTLPLMQDLCKVNRDIIFLNTDYDLSIIISKYRSLVDFGCGKHIEWDTITQ
jgi:hypothetical protein